MQSTTPAPTSAPNVDVAYLYRLQCCKNGGPQHGLYFLACFWRGHTRHIWHLFEHGKSPTSRVSSVPDTVTRIGNVEVYPHIDFANRVRDAAEEARAMALDAGTGLWWYKSYATRQLAAQEHAERAAAAAATWSSKIDSLTVRSTGFALLHRLRPPPCPSCPLESRPLVQPRLRRRCIAPPAARPPATAARRQSSAAHGGRARDAPNVMEQAASRIPPDMPEGHQCYAAMVQAWRAHHAVASTRDSPLEVVGYPLSPGTAPPCSGECFNCGRTGHRRATCPSMTPLAAFEHIFRSPCAQHLGSFSASLPSTIPALAPLSYFPSSQPPSAPHSRHSSSAPLPFWEIM
ncbi:hypothetical protein GGX14DRAFT_559670 [Mycena pura]|uniref:CCHC-type domain-containing protein n=1 Tax=Mycena pura TaxID=153505 RepID=A0AAD6YJ31_9AGAR|nr:hypothetical protein GGX14DRAFT_559670 [Mycena pura]